MMMKAGNSCEAPKHMPLPQPSHFKQVHLHLSSTLKLEIQSDSEIMNLKKTPEQFAGVFIEDIFNTFIVTIYH